MVRLERRRLESLVKKFSAINLLVVGDMVLDEYLWGDVTRISPEAPVPVLHVKREATVLGGAGNVVRNIVALGARSEFCALIGDGAPGQRVIELLEELGVDSKGMIKAHDRPTIVKTRVVAQSQQIVRFDRETEAAVPPDIIRKLRSSVRSALERVDGVILEDYGKGVLSKNIARGIMKECMERKLPVAVDPKIDIAPFRGASLMKPNLAEAEMLTGIRVRNDADLDRVGQQLRRRCGGGDVIITRGSQGMSLFDKSGKRVDVSTPPLEVYDVQGAGDTTIAALVLSLRAGGSLLEAAVIANAAAGVVVSKTGTATANPEEVLAALPEVIAAAKEKR
jgi:D-beta-D-heptose 7-phosphate kinase/D-beta-D-heptose 1-phosphate adenosyltransferase